VEIVSRHRRTLKAFKGEGAAERAYKFAQWFMAGPAGNQRAQEFCRSHGIKLERAHTEKINEDGGFTVPPEFSNEIIDLREEYGIFRANAKVEPMAGDVKSVRRRTGGLTAYAVGEGQRGTESKKGWDLVELVARKWMVLAKVTNELNEDSIVDFGDDLASESAYAFSNAEDDAGFNGDGTSTYNGIRGVCTKIKGLHATIANIAGLVVASGNAYSEIVRGDLVSVMGRLPQYAYKRGQPKWFVSQRFWAEVMVNITLAAGGATAAEIEGQRQKTFLGYPVEIAQVMPAVEANSQVCALFGALNLAATLGDRRTMALAMTDSNDVDFEEDQIAIRATTRIDINAHDVGNASATANLRKPGPIVGLITAAS
jgi:HK97 family phage major capsid protein